MALKISNAKLKELILKHFGNVKKICESAQISRQSFYDRCERYPELKDLLADAREVTIDVAESKLLKLIEEGHYPSRTWYDRGCRCEACKLVKKFSRKKHERKK